MLFTLSSPSRDAGDVFVLDLTTGKAQMVVADGVAGRYVSTGHLVFLRGELSLWRHSICSNSRFLETRWSSSRVFASNPAVRCTVCAR